jgi:hypothetical protein
MGRLVQSASRHRGGLEGVSRDGVDGKDDEFASRVSKYIPSEVLAAYLALENILAPTIGGAPAAAQTLATTAVPAVSSMSVTNPMAFGVFIIGLVFTPIYIGVIGSRSKQPWALHAVVATIAFCVWAYAMKGSFFTTQLVGAGQTLYHGPIAAATLVIFSLISGLVKPQSHDG